MHRAFYTANPAGARILCRKNTELLTFTDFAMRGGFNAQEVESATPRTNRGRETR